jgi:hypothetical protein
LRDAGDGRVQDPDARIVPNLDTESTALDDAVTPDEARGLRVSVALSEQS